MSADSMTNPNPNPGNPLIGKLGTWLMIVATVALAFLMLVEVINILFYDPFSDEKFLFKFSGSMSDIRIGPLTYIMFGSLAVLLMMGLPLAFVTGGLGVMFIYLVGDSMMLNIIEFSRLRVDDVGCRAPTSSRLRTPAPCAIS